MLSNFVFKPNSGLLGIFGLNCVRRPRCEEHVSNIYEDEV